MRRIFLAAMIVVGLALGQRAEAQVTWGHWRIVDAMNGPNVSTLEASLNGLQAAGWTIFMVAPIVRATNPVPCDAACVKASGQGWAFADGLYYDIVAYKSAGGPAVAPGPPTAVVPAPATPPAPAGLPTCQDRTGAPVTGWIKLAGGGWVPPDNPLSTGGLCVAR